MIKVQENKVLSVLVNYEFEVQVSDADWQCPIIFFVANGEPKYIDTLYLSKDVLFINIASQIKRYVITFIAYIGSIGLLSRLKVSSHNYMEWILYAGGVFLMSSFITIVVNYILDKKGTRDAIRLLIYRNKKG